MKSFLLVVLCTSFLLITSPHCFSQVLYHPTNLILSNGDTINKINQSGLYEGYHIITDNAKNSTSDSNYYKKGFFSNGVPINEWMEHKADGTWSTGKYTVSRETFHNDAKGWVTLTRGTGAKTGEWRYYKKDGSLSEIILHETYIKGVIHIQKESLKIDSTEYMLTYYKKVKQRNGGNIFSYSKEITKNSNGVILSKTNDNFIRSKTIKYNRNGEKQSMSRYSNIYNRSVTIKFNRHGKKSSKTISKQWKGKMEGCPAYFW